MSAQPLILEKIFNAPVHKVWEALSNRDQMKQWYFDIAEFKPEVGFSFSFLAGDGEKKYLHLCRITEVIPDKKLSYSWRYDGYTGDSEVSFELFAVGDQTRLVLTHKGLETFPSEINPDLASQNFLKGWTHFMHTALRNFVEKEQ
ncbi:MAG: SRPBCC domain-containing protein [Bacteroidota bacterium]